MSILAEPFVGTMARNPTTRGDVGRPERSTVSYTYRIGNESFAVLFECLIRQGRVLRRVFTYCSPCCNRQVVPETSSKPGPACWLCSAPFSIGLVTCEVSHSAVEENPEATLRPYLEEWLSSALSDPLSAVLEAGPVADEVWRYSRAIEAKLPGVKGEKP